MTTVRTVDCSESHNAEVYHAFDIGFGGSYDEVAVLTAADEGCFAAFEAYLGIRYEESAVYSRAFYPLLESWNDGEREVIIPDGANFAVRFNESGPLVVNIARTLELANRRKLSAGA